MVCKSSLRALSEASLRTSGSAVPCSAPAVTVAATTRRGLSAQATSLHLRQLLVQERIRQLSLQQQTRAFSASAPPSSSSNPQSQSAAAESDTLSPPITPDSETIKREISRGVEFDRETQQPAWVVPERSVALPRNLAVPAKPRVRSPQEATPEQTRTWRSRAMYYTDPFHLAAEIDRLIKKGQIEDALGMTRVASKNMNTVVPWGYLIGYYLEGDTIQQGIKLFNEMKKRKQYPSVKTYTVMFSSLAKSTHTSRAIREAVRIYISMLNDKRSPPNTIHMNAVLEVCARGHDLDSLYAVAATADKGLRQPDSVTFAIMFNAMRSYLEDGPKMALASQDTPEEYLRDHVMPMIKKAKALWERVVGDWVDGRLAMSEKLVCAFGRLIMMGPWGIQIQVLLLLEQTMGIPVLVKEIESIMTQRANYGLLRRLQLTETYEQRATIHRLEDPDAIERMDAVMKAKYPHANDKVDDFELEHDDELDVELALESEKINAKTEGTEEAIQTPEIDEAEMAKEDESSTDQTPSSGATKNPYSYIIDAIREAKSSQVTDTTSEVLSNRLKKRLDQAKRKQERIDRRAMRAEIVTYGKPVSAEAVAIYKKMIEEGIRVPPIKGEIEGVPSPKEDQIETEANPEDEVEAEEAEEAEAEVDVETEGKAEIDRNANAIEPVAEAHLDSDRFEKELSSQEIWRRNNMAEFRMPLTKKGGNVITPGPNTLSMLMRLLGTQRRTASANRYWQILTSAPYKVEPDDDNWRSFLQAQRRGHNSGNIVKTLEAMPGLCSHDIVTAMLGCLEDKDNMSSLPNAGRVLEIMHKEMLLVPPTCLAVYVELTERYYRKHIIRKRTALNVHTRLSNSIGEAITNAADSFRKNQLDLIERSQHILKPDAAGTSNASSAGKQASSRNAGPTRELPLNLKRGIVSASLLARRLIGVIDGMVAEGMLRDEVLVVMELTKGNLARYLTEFDSINFGTSNGWAEWKEFEALEKKRSAKKQQRREVWFLKNPRRSVPDRESITDSEQHERDKDRNVYSRPKERSRY
ncbi:hypothetical protein BROUX41_003871 [Berkeleyomyces rouxiae]|uniref:uncharacterized protein n=1 Tax=Berkeleyomyces rouxiae TaxID=2035830 RepID=UPI003B7D47AC